MTLVRGAGWVAFVLVAAGCRDARQGPERLPTVPVNGTVTVDGGPAAQLTVKLHSLATPQGEAEIYAAKPSGLTDAEGRFALSTYEQGDGVAAGEYAVTFEWLTFNLLQNSYGGPDKLKGKYADPKTTGFKVTITGEEEGPVVLGPFELTK